MHELYCVNPKLNDPAISSCEFRMSNEHAARFLYAKWKEHEILGAFILLAMTKLIKSFLSVTFPHSQQEKTTVEIKLQLKFYVISASIIEIDIS